MYDWVHNIWDNIKDNVWGDNVVVSAKCFLSYDYPELHPLQGEEREELWGAICDSGWNPLYDNGVTLPTLTLPRDINEGFDTFIGMDCPPPNWNEGLDQELTKDLHLISAFHNLFDHMNFAITDFTMYGSSRRKLTLKSIKRCDMTFKELLDSVQFEDVAPHIVRMYPDMENSIGWYKFHFDMLRLMNPVYHEDANDKVCHITMKDWEDGSGQHLNAYPMEGDLWEHSLTKELIIAPEVKASNEELAASGKRVIIAGLDMDFKGVPFGPMPALCAIAEDVTKVHAICVRCGDLAYISHRIVQGDSRVMLGETQEYEPLCRHCYEEVTKKKTRIQNTRSNFF